MGIEVISEFIAKATVRVVAYIYDDDGELTDPATGGSIKLLSGTLMACRRQAILVSPTAQVSPLA